MIIEPEQKIYYCSLHKICLIEAPQLLDNHQDVLLTDPLIFNE